MLMVRHVCGSLLLTQAHPQGHALSECINSYQKKYALVSASFLGEDGAGEEVHLEDGSVVAEGEEEDVEADDEDDVYHPGDEESDDVEKNWTQQLKPSPYPNA